MFQKSHAFKGHNGSVYALEKLSYNNFLSGSGDTLVVKWDTGNADAGEIIARANGVIYVLCHLHNNNLLLLGTSTGGIHVIDLIKHAELHLLQYHKQGVFDIKYSVIKNLMVIASGEGIITFCRLNDFSIIKQEHLCNAKLRSIAFSNDDEQIAVGCGDGSIVIYETESLNIVNRFQAHKTDWSTNVVCYHPVQDILLSASRDAMMNVYDIKNNFRMLDAIAAHNYAIYDIQFSPDRKFLATASRDKSVKIWNAGDLSFLQKLDKEKSEGHVNSVNKLLWVDENNLLSCSDDRSIILWKTAQQ